MSGIYDWCAFHFGIKFNGDLSKDEQKKKKKELLKELSSGENPLSKQRSFSHWSLCFATL